MTTLLKPIYDSRNDFYGKAELDTTPDKITLYSYNTAILELDKKSGKIKFLTKNEKHFSLTTCRHIREFLRQYTSETATTKSDFLKLANA